MINFCLLKKGLTSNDPKNYSLELRNVKLEYLDQQACVEAEENLERLVGGLNFTTQICAGN